jgi:hypothetical protein
MRKRNLNPLIPILNIMRPRSMDLQIQSTLWIKEGRGLVTKSPPNPHTSSKTETVEHSIRNQIYFLYPRFLYTLLYVLFFVVDSFIINHHIIQNHRMLKFRRPLTHSFFLMSHVLALLIVLFLIIAIIFFSISSLPFSKSASSLSYFASLLFSQTYQAATMTIVTGMSTAQ